MHEAVSLSACPKKPRKKPEASGPAAATRLADPRWVAFLACGTALFVAQASHAGPPPWAPLSLEAPAPVSRSGCFELPDVLAEGLGVDRYLSPSVERTPDAYLTGRYGPLSWRMVPPLTIGPLDGDPWLLTPSAFSAPLLAEGDASALLLGVSPWQRIVKKACKKRSINMVRYGGESDTLQLLGCNGEIMPDAIDRISVLARPTNAERPTLPLPDEPDPSAAHGEWVEHVKLVPPRLLWVLQKLAEAFPSKPLYFISGYRPGPHGGAHAQGRAIDLYVMTVPNEKVYEVCRKLPDVGCGYYPNNHFVHVDVRRPGTGKAYWIDTSGPGEPSHYVDSWPGVEASGAAVWKGSE